MAVKKKTIKNKNKNKEGVQRQPEGYRNMVLPGIAHTVGDHSLLFVKNIGEILKKADEELYGIQKGREHRV